MGIIFVTINMSRFPSMSLRAISGQCSSTSTCDCTSCTSGRNSTALSSISSWTDSPGRVDKKHRESHHSSHSSHHSCNHDKCDGSSCTNPDRYPRYDPGVSMFTSVVTPVTGLTPLYSGVTGSVEFRMRRKNKTVILQWEPFTGTMAASGVAFLTVAQSISNTPPYPYTAVIYIQYRGEDRPVKIVVDPNARGSNVRMYLNTNSSTTSITTGDSFQVYGGSVEWIVE